jgi:hypothetical protein
MNWLKKEGIIMKKKLIVVVTLLGVGLLLGVGAYAMSENNAIQKIFSKDERDSIPQGAISDLVKQLESNGFADQSITKVYQSNEFGLLGMTNTGEIIEELSIAKRSLSDVNEAFPIEYLREINDHLLYVVYKVETEDKEPYSVYLFFEKLDSKTEQVTEGTELWWLTGRVMFAAKALSYKDFEHILIGSSLEEVAKIDPMTKSYKPHNVEPYTAQKYDEKIEQYVEYIASPEPELSFKAYHLLRDGILSIIYKRSSGDEEFVVSAIGFNHSSEIASIHGSGALPLIIHDVDFPNK